MHFMILYTYKYKGVIPKYADYKVDFAPRTYVKFCDIANKVANEDCQETLTNEKFIKDLVINKYYY